MDNLDLYNTYTAYSDMTQPIRYPDYDEEMQWIREVIDEWKERYETAKDEEKEQLEEEIQGLEESYRDMELNCWQISSKMIERYRKWQNLYKVQGYTFFNDLYTAENDEERYQEFAEIFHNMENAKISPEELLGGIDKKVRMIRLENN